MPMRADSRNRSSSRAAPSSIENSVWVCRWTKLSALDVMGARLLRPRALPLWVTGCVLGVGWWIVPGVIEGEAARLTPGSDSSAQPPTRAARRHRRHPDGGTSQSTRGKAAPGGRSRPVSPESRVRWRTRIAGLRMDLTPLRTSRDFRVLFGAGFVFYLGAMVGYVAVPFQLYALTGSNFAVGALGLAQLVPLIVAGLYGGALADRLDRRRVLVLTGVVPVAGTGALLVNALATHPSLAVLYGVGVLLVVAQSLQSPSRQALVPRTVRHRELPAAVALSSVGAQVGMLAGPALGGLLLATAGAPWAYGVTLVGFAGATALFALLRPYPPLAEPTGSGTLREIYGGVVYAARRPALLGTY